MMFVMMLLGGTINSWAQEEKVLYSTTFQEWDTMFPTLPSDPPATVDKETTDGQTLTFSLSNSLVEPEGTQSKFTQSVISVGYVRAEKNNDKIAAYFETSVLKSVTKVKFVQAATGGKGVRGWNVAYRVEGETEWTTVYDTGSQTTSGELISVDINKENVQVRFYNRYPTENAYMTSLEIDGNVYPVSTANVSFYDTDGTTLIGKATYTADGSAQYPKLTYQYGAANVTIPEGNVFCGWFNGTSKYATKVREGSDLYCDINLYAKTSPKEEALDGTEYTYDLKMESWYPEDHELIDISKGSYSGIHGWLIQKKGTIKIQVAKNSQINVTQCKTGSKGTITVTDASGKQIAQFDNRQASEDVVTTIIYNGDQPTTLTFTMSANTYIHAINIVNFNPVYATFKFQSDKIEGTCPDKTRGNDKNEIEMPGNVFFFRQGWTFVGWTDANVSDVYEAGKKYVFNEDVTLYPKFVENTFDLTEAGTNITVTWPLDHTEAPAINVSKSATPVVYTKSPLVVDEKQDIAMTIDATAGGVINTDARINSLSGGAKGAAVYDGTKFKFRAIYGMKVMITASDKVDAYNKNNTTIFGTGATNASITLSDADAAATETEISEDGKTFALQYNGDATTLELTVHKAGSTQDFGFFDNITVIYPNLPDVWAKSIIEDRNTEKYPNEENNNAGKAKIVTYTPHTNTGSRYKEGEKVTVTGIPSYGYYVAGFRALGKELETRDSVDVATGDKLKVADFIVVPGQTSIEVLYRHLPLYKVVVKPSDNTLGSATISPVYSNFYNEVCETNKDGSKGKQQYIESWYTKDTQVTLSADAAEECVIDYWTEEGSETKLTDQNTYTFDVGTTDRIIVVHLKQGELGSVIFDISEAHVNGESVASIHRNALSMTIDPIENVRSFTVPTNYTFFKSVDDDDITNTPNAYHLLYWEDKADKDVDGNYNRYELGKTYSFKTHKTITLTPVFTANPTTRTNRVNNPLVRYDFGTKVYSYYDSSSKETRNTCAPEVNIGNNINTYWTAQAYFEVLTNGVVTPHTRDVTMYVNTGSKGYIRNEGLGDWCAFGPGTTFWCTSSAGTTVTIMSYSKITTTTVDGVVPTLDEKRTAEERERVGNDHAYVYSYTTQNSATTMPIVIGDDYTYYQWIEVQMLAANLVHQYTSVDDELHGKINDVESLSDYGATEREDGSVAFRSGDRIRISFERLFGFEFDKFVEPGRPDDDGNPTVLFKMNDDGTVDMVDDYYVMQHNIPSHIDDNGNITWGTASGEGKTVFTLTAIEPTEKEAADGKRTRYELEYGITSNHEMEIVFKEKPTYYITYNPGQLASGIAPVAQWVEAGDKFTAHQNQTLYYEGNTLDYWVDADYDENMTDDEKEKHIYHTGTDYRAPAMDLRLYPVFSPNDFNILSLDKNLTATWNFTKNDGAPEINYEGTAGILVTQLYDGDKHIDLKIDIDAIDHGTGKGKFNNTSSDDRIQINANSIINFPSSPNCVVNLTVTSKDPSVAVVAGKKKGDEGYTIAADQKSIDVVCSGDTAVQQLQFVGDGVYGKSFAVTYKPQTAPKATIEKLSCGDTEYDAAEIKRQMDADGHITFTVSPWENSNEEIPDVTGTATEGGEVHVTKGTVTVPRATATVHTPTGFTVETYPIVFKFNTPDDYPLFQKVTVNGVEYTETDNVVQDVPQSGIIKVLFNRTMQETTFNIPELQLTSTSSAGKELEFKYWDLPEGGTIQLNITPDLEMFKDIYGMVYQQPLYLTLHITKSADSYHHNPFDFIVGKDGSMDDAIAAANANTKDDEHRYYIFVPDGEWEMQGNAGNGKTEIKKSNVSIIGQSKEGATIWNDPEKEGIGITATIYIDRRLHDFYCEDLTIENRYDYWGAGGGAGRAVAFHDRGSRSIMKNVSLKSFQDTYYSNNSDPDSRGYFENSDLYGVVDFLCGDGNIWLEKCNIILRDRTGNNIAAPSTQPSQQWGYVFNNCTIKPESDNPQQLKGKDWTLARPWGDSPAATYLNTKMITQPTEAGWQKMTTDLRLRFHEYRSMNGDGTALLTLGTRTLAACAPGVGTDDCVLSAKQAAQYTLRNVVGGTDAFEPNELCRQIDAASSAVADRDENNEIWQDNIEVDDDILRWDAYEQALCYFVFKYENGNWKYILNTTDNFADITDYGTGYYCVRAANQRGGLGAQTESVLYELRDPYELTIKQLDDLQVDGVPYGWSTICLPFNARVPEGVTVYAATAHDKTSAEDKVEDFVMTLTPVQFIDSEKGYVVYGPAGQYYFSPSSRKCDKETILTGNATAQPLSTVNNNGYVLSNKSWGLGFYRYTGTTYAPYKAWLPESMVSDVVSDALATGTRAIRFKIDGATDSIYPSVYGDSTKDDAIYDLNGKRVNTNSPQGIYVSRKRGKIVNK